MKEDSYIERCEAFVKEIEINVCLPKLVEAIKSEVFLILKEKQQNEQQNNTNIHPD